MLLSIRATGRVPTPYGPPAPTIEAPDDPLSWHALAELGPHSTRRRRRLDLLAGGSAGDGRHHVDVHFRDSHRGDAGEDETVVHEYALTATLDAGAGHLVAITPAARVLPWQECPGALGSASRIEGVPLADIGPLVRRDLVGVTTCTHLNDTVRSLADLSALVTQLG
jgi:hypothetical protein